MLKNPFLVQMASCLITKVVATGSGAAINMMVTKDFLKEGNINYVVGHCKPGGMFSQKVHDRFGKTALCLFSVVYSSILCVHVIL